jgi:hypothetical protein
VAHRNDLNAMETEINIFCLPGIEPRYNGRPGRSVSTILNALSLAPYKFIFVSYLTMSRESVVSIGYGLDDRGFEVRV